MAQKQVTVHVKRLDLAHLPVAGNKYFKLKYNLDRAVKEGYDTLLTFGGAFSNHILATALAGKEIGMKTIGLIRGEEVSGMWNNNPTLRAASEAGMQLSFISRDDYRKKTSQDFIENLQNEFGSFYLLPEGGTNKLAVLGSEEILGEKDAEFGYICCPVGTGGTMAGLINASTRDQTVLGFASLKGHNFQEDIRKFTPGENWRILGDYHFGGYARISQELILFINKFRSDTGIPLDPVYTGKMMFGLIDLVSRGFFPAGSSILAVHTGGLQGIEGMNKLLRKKNLPLIGL
jgi:1-aminocyclopropane-1-carboxylate deaminase